MLKKILFGIKFDDNRIQWIDNAKGLCMFLVILVHSGYMPDIYKYLLEPFFLTTFFFISGYLFHNPKKEFNFKLKILKILETILFPYLIYWILSYSVDHLIKGDFIFYNLLLDVLMGNKLWFIAALFMSQIMFTVLICINNNLIFILCFSIGSVLFWYFTPLSDPLVKYPWSINSALIANFFIGLGYIGRIYSKWLIKAINDKSKGIVGVLVYLICVTVNYTYFKFPYNFPGNMYGNYFVPVVMAIAVVIILIFPIIFTNKYFPIMVGRNKVLSKRF
jgi:fucose 4-O-acetylase-like acetyltransferase